MDAVAKREFRTFRRSGIYRRRFMWRYPWSVTDWWKPRVFQGSDEWCDPSVALVLPPLGCLIVFWRPGRMRTMPCPDDWAAMDDWQRADYAPCGYLHGGRLREAGHHHVDGVCGEARKEAGRNVTAGRYCPLMSEDTLLPDLEMPLRRYTVTVTVPRADDARDDVPQPPGGHDAVQLVAAALCADGVASAWTWSQTIVCMTVEAPRKCDALGTGLALARVLDSGDGRVTVTAEPAMPRH